MCSRRVSLAAVTMLALAACNTVDPRTGSVDRQFGEAVAWNKTVQTINPDPVYTADGAQPGADGAKAAEATKRYRTDKVKRVERVSTSQGGSSGSSGGSGPN